MAARPDGDRGRAAFRLVQFIGKENLKINSHYPVEITTENKACVYEIMPK